MIKTTLELEDYCQNCPYFEADVLTERLYANNEPMMFVVAVKCCHRGICRRVRTQLSEVPKNDES